MCYGCLEGFYIGVKLFKVFGSLVPEVFLLGAKRRVLFDVSHKEFYDPLDSGTHGYSRVKDFLSANGFDVEKIRSFDGIDKNSMLVVAAPTLSFSRDDIEKILVFVDSGGCLLLIGEWGHGSKCLDGLAKMFGCSYHQDILLDWRHNLYGHPEWVVVSTFARHPITREVGNVCMFGACSIGCSKSCEVLARASPYCYSDEGFYRSGDCPPVVAMLHFGDGLVVLLCDGSCFKNINLDELDNRVLMENLFGWLAKWSKG